MSLNYSFSGKKVLVTGGAGGIGRQLVQRLYTGGATVFTVDKNAEGIQKLKQELPGVTAEVVDLADWQETRKVVQGFGVLDGLVNNAACGVWEDFLGITRDAAKLQYNVNFEAVINVSQVVAQAMIDAGSTGTIVNISSVIAEKYLTGRVVYGALKAGLNTLTKSMAVELGAKGIRVNCIQPGAVDTPLSKDAQGQTLKETQEMVVNHTVLQRLVSTDELANLALFLLSPLSSAIVGQVISVDGGWLQ